MNTHHQAPPHNNKPPKKEEQKDMFDFTKLPPNACCYCGIHGIENVVKCLDCNKWFCNNKHGKQQESDIVLHMIVSRHSGLSVIDPPTGKVFSLQCECPDCDRPETDPFKLSVFYKKADRSLHIYCTDYVMKTKKLPPGEWELLLQEKRLSTWMVPLSPKKDLEKSRTLIRYQINALEGLWKDGSNIKFEELKDAGLKPKREIFLQSVQDSYQNVDEYLRIYLPLIEAEAESDKSVRATWGQNNVPIQWDTKKGEGYQEEVRVEFEYTKHKCYAYLSCDNEKYFDGRLAPSDKLEISQEKPNEPKWKVEGLIKYVKDDEICLVFPKSSRPQTKISQVNVRYIWMSVTYDRMTDSLLRMKNEYKNSEVLRYIIDPPKSNKRKNTGTPEEQKEDPIDPIEYYHESLSKIKNQNLYKSLDNHCRSLASFNDSQIEAIKLAQSSWPVVSIQGPPGTGKTVTLTAIIKLLTTNLSKKTKILCCAPSNVAVDHLTEHLMNLGVKVLRIYSKSRENLEESNNPKLEPVSLHQIIRKGKSKKLQEYLDLKADGIWLEKHEQKEFMQLYEAAEKAIIKEAQVICCTCITAGGFKPSQYNFKYVAVDEAAQAVEPETLIPILYGAKKVFLVGDHKQLGPVITCKQAAGAKFDQSLFERMALAVKPYRLNVQYRMHPGIAAFPSKWFYDNQLLTFRDINRPVNKNFPWPDKTKPRFFYNVVGKEEIPPSRMSLMNRQEAEVVKQAINRITGMNVRPEQVGVITPYRGQKLFIQQMQKRNEIPKAVEIASVNEFQGREKDYIIISCVRSNLEVGIGFLMDKRRLNVALTRAKYGLIICGNAHVLTQDQIWRELIIEYKEEGLIVEGDFRNLKPSNIEIKGPSNPKPKDAK